MENWVERIGFWSATIAFVALSGYCAVTFLQILGLVTYPWDAILIFGLSLLIATPFMLAMLVVHYITPEEKRFWSHAALLFAVMYNTFVTINYVVQLTAVIPYGNSNLAQTPHSLFWTLDALGYIFMGLATLSATPVFGKQGLQKWIRWFFLANGLVTPLVALVYFYPTSSSAWNLGTAGLSPPFSTALSPLMLLGSPWVITAPGSMLLLALFLAEGRDCGEASEQYELHKVTPNCPRRSAACFDGS
jgi:uncharacterized membrane protein